MNASWPRPARWRLPAAGFALVAAFAVLAGRFWHPYYGFTRFVQLDEADHRVGIPEMRAHPIFVYQGFNGYDGAAYMQLAFHPLLGSPDLPAAIDNIPYRARRILGSALAWLFAGGRPEHIAAVYAALNLGVWLLLAGLLWRVLPVTDPRSLLAWAGVMFSAGVLHCVRLALADLLAATLATAALWLGEKGQVKLDAGSGGQDASAPDGKGQVNSASGEKGQVASTFLGLAERGQVDTGARNKGQVNSTVAGGGGPAAEKGQVNAVALGILAAAGLARETVLMAVVALWRGPWTSPRAWRTNGLRTALVALPLLAWVGYVRWKAGPADPGFGNLTWPIIGWVEKWGEIAADFVRHPEFRVLVASTLLATIALTVQAAHLLRRLRWDSAWWRAGVVGVVLMALLGTAVWEGHPGAATRVLLPMSIAFAVLAVRDGASWRWIVGGSLGIFSGVLALWDVPQDPGEIAAGRGEAGAFVAKIETGWFGLETHGRARWSWAENRAVLLVETAARTAMPLRLRLEMRGMTPRELEIWSGGTLVARAQLAARYAWIDLPPVAPLRPGLLRLELRSAAPPVRESADPGARALGFAVRGVELK